MRLTNGVPSNLPKTLVQVVAVLLTAAVLAVLPVSPAFAAESLSMAKSMPANVLVGAPTTVTLTVTNNGDVPEFNLSLRDQLPTGVTYVAGSTSPAQAGEPRTVTGGTPARQTLVWENISDLPVGASTTLTFQVQANPATYPVGATFSNTAQSYANSNPRLIPKFDANLVLTPGTATAQAVSNTATTTVTAIQIRKAEPSPEGELLRGIHNHDTQYTLTVTNNGGNANNNVAVVDFLPAQLEFLGCGTVDNTPLLPPTGPTEYPTAPRLDVSTADVPGCTGAQVPFSVATVTDPPGIPAGVYTRVEWRLGTLTPGQVTNIVYAAGIPQRSNTMTFQGGAPTPTSGQQTANLGNNTGPSTRETTTEQALTNRAAVLADYTGPVHPGTLPAVVDNTSHTVTAEDLAMQKSVSPGTFNQGALATYTLRLQAGEYADASGIAIVDTLPDGMCPMGGPGVNYAGSDPQCDGTGSTAPSVPFASPPVQNPNGTWTLRFSDIAIAADGTATVTYQARMRSTYFATGDPTVSGDSYTNNVSLTAQTTTLASVDPPGGVSTEDVGDASSSTITSDSLSLNKRIQPNTTNPYTCSNDPSAYVDGGAPTLPSLTFSDDSRVCFTIRVDFPAGSQTKNPFVVDFLPDYLQYEAGSAVAMPGNNVTTSFDPTNLVFTLGDPVGSNRFVQKGGVFFYRLSGIVVKTPAVGVTTPDITANLAKLRWVSTNGGVQFLRDSEDFSIAPPPPVAVTKAANRITAVPPGITGTLPDGGNPAANLRIRAGDVVEFTVTLRNNGTAANRNNVPVVGPDTWDRLPRGITCADVSLISAGGLCTNPGDATHPTFSDRTTRSAIRWNTADTTTIAAGATLAFTYRITYPATVAASRSYRNDVDVASYATESNRQTLVQHYPASNVDTTVPADQIDVPQAHDDHTLLTPANGITKTNDTQVDDTTQGTDGALNYATIGETVTYTVTGTLPANTTIYNGALFDTTPTGIRVDSVIFEYRDSPTGVYGPLPAGWTTSLAAPGPRVNFATPVNAGVADDQVRMTITSTVVNLAATDHGDVITNTARLSSSTEFGAANTTQSASSSITIVEPNPAPTKSANPTAPTAGSNVTFTLTARNLRLPTLFEARMVDCVPAGLTVIPASLSLSPPTAFVGAVGTQGCAADRTPVVWEVGDLPGNLAVWPVLTYQATVDPAAAGGATYTNTATLTGTSMDGADPDERTYSQTTTATVTVPGGALTKDVVPDRAPIGARVTYTITVDLPADVNFYDATIIDTLPAGIDVASVLLVSSTCAYTSGAPGPCGVVATNANKLGPTGQLHGWGLGNVLSDRARRVTVTYSALVADIAGNTPGTTLTNSAVLKWNRTDTPTTPGLTDPFDATTTPDTAVVTVLAPSLSIEKTVDDPTPVPGQVFTYTIRVTNATGANISTAHDVTVVDTFPAGVVPITPISGASVSGNQITWTDVGPIAPGAFLDLTYTARLATPAPSTPQTNSADITRYTSVDNGGHVYDGPSDTAVVQAGLPVINVDKTLLDGPPAYIGEPTGWRIVVTNTGQADAFNVDVTDVLPIHWAYNAGSAQVSVAGGATQQINPATAGSPVQTLTWDNLGDLDPGENITIDFTATPGSGVVPANVGSAVPHVNTAASTAEDLNVGGNVVTQDDDTAQTRIDSADVEVIKVANGPAVAGRPFTWTLTVRNNGLDTAVGPFRVVDTLPIQVTGATASGTGWNCSTGILTITCDRTGTLASGASFPDITVTATVPAGIPAGANLVNRATVEAETYDPVPGNNQDDTTTPVTRISDFGIEKQLTSAFVPGTPVTYTLAITNGGPSVSAGPIVVKDTLPAELDFVSYTGAPDWVLTENGQELTFTWAGATPVGLGSLPQITITADLASDVTTQVTNTATVSEPTDPTTGPELPDSDSVDATPTPVADLGITKAHIGDFDAGTNGVYELVVTNHGPSDAAGPLTVTDQLDDALTYVAGSATNGWTCSANGTNLLTCTRTAGLPATPVAQASSTFRITVAIDQALTGDLTNTACVTQQVTTDPNVANDCDTDNTGIDVLVDLGIVKTLVTDPVVAGQPATFEIVVTNHGPAQSPGPIEMTDVLPAGLTYVSASGTGWTCPASIPGQLFTCTRTAALPVGAAPTITVVVAVASGLGTTTLTNIANVDGPAPDPGPFPNTDTEPVPVTEDTEITVTKTTVDPVPPAPVRAGENVTFEIVVSSSGPSDARQVTASDVLEAGMTLVSIGGTGWTCTEVPLVCTRDRIVAGTSAPVITVVAKVGTGVADGETLTNSVRVATITPGDDTQNNDDDADVGVVAEADLAIVKEHATNTAVAGLPTEFTLQVSNLGPSDALRPIRVVDTLPPGFSFLSSVGTNWTCTPTVGTQEVVCLLDQDLLGGTPAAPTLAPLLTLRVQVAESANSGTVTNTATVSSPTTDPNPGNNTDPEDVTVQQQADVGIVKSHTGAVRVGDELTFTLLVSNAGPSEARNVVVTDDLPDGLQYVSASGPDWTCTEAASVVRCALGAPLAHLDTSEITLVVRVLPGAYPTVTNVADVTTSTPDPNEANDSDDDVVPVPPLVDLAITKTHVGEFVVGQQGAYDLVVTNNGPTSAPGPITVTDALPTGLAYVGATGGGFTCAALAALVTCVRDLPLGVGESVTIKLTVDVLPTAYPQVVNTAVVGSPSEETNTTNNTDPDTAPVTPTIELVVDKEALLVTTDRVVYRLRVTNNGPNDTVAPIRLRDPMPDGLRLVSAEGDGWSCTVSPGLATCVYADVLAAGASSSVRLVADIVADPGTEIENVATVAGGGDGSPSDDDETITVPGDDDGGPDGGEGGGDLPGTGAPLLAIVTLGLALVVGGALLHRWGRGRREE